MEVADGNDGVPTEKRFSNVAALRTAAATPTPVRPATARATTRDANGYPPANPVVSPKNPGPRITTTVTATSTHAAKDPAAEPRSINPVRHARTAQPTANAVTAHDATGAIS